MKSKKIQLILLIFPFIFYGNLFAQFHFVFTSNTGNNATVGIPISANPNINGASLQNGDEIGVFAPNGLCVGAVIWQNQNTAITVWGDNDMTSNIDGIKPGEQMYFRIWKKITGTEISNCTVSYSLGNGIYTINGIYILSALSAFTSEVRLTDLNEILDFNLSQNFPNPFNDKTKFILSLLHDAFVILDVADPLGCKLENILTGHLSAGIYEINYCPKQLTSGIYLLRATMKLNDISKSVSIIRKFVITK